MSTVKRVGQAVYAGAFGLLALGALATENIARIVQGTYHPVDLWSYFTYQSNLVAAVALLASTFAIWRGTGRQWVDNLRGAATLYMVITGVVFALLVHNASPAVAIDNNIMHQVIPAAVVVDWFVINRIARRIPYGRAAWWLAYPLAYAVYASIRGVVTGSYMYAFLDPAKNSGYEGVLLIIAALTAFAAIVAWVISRVPCRK